MDLFLKAKTNVPDLIIDFIEVELKSGKTVSLNWDRSSTTGFESEQSTGFTAEYSYLYFGEEDAKGRLSELEDMRVVAVWLYSETYPVADITILEMTFSESKETLTVKNMYSAEGVSCDG